MMSGFGLLHHIIPTFKKVLNDRLYEVDKNTQSTYLLYSRDSGIWSANWTVASLVERPVWKPNLLE